MLRSMIFVLHVRPEEDALLKESLDRSYPQKSIQAAPGLYFVSVSNGTAKSVSDAVGISDGPIKVGLVASIGSYYGRLAPHVWEWVATNWP